MNNWPPPQPYQPAPPPPEVRPYIPYQQVRPNYFAKPKRQMPLGPLSFLIVGCLVILMLWAVNADDQQATVEEAPATTPVPAPVETPVATAPPAVVLPVETPAPVLEATMPPIPETTGAAVVEGYGYGSVAGNDLQIDDIEWAVMSIMLEAPGYTRDQAAELGANLCIVAVQSPTKEDFLAKMLIVSEVSGASAETLGTIIGVVGGSMCYDLLSGLGMMS